MEWGELVTQAQPVVVIATIAALIGLVGLVVKLWPFISNAVAIVNALVKLPQIDVRLGRLERQVDDIHHETHKNDGSSIKDAMGRVEEGVAGLHGRMDDVDRQLAVLTREDEALWAAIEETQNPEEETP